MYVFISSNICILTGVVVCQYHGDYLFIGCMMCCIIVGIGFGGLWRFAGPFTKVCYKCLLLLHF